MECSQINLFLLKIHSVELDMELVGWMVNPLSGYNLRSTACSVSVQLEVFMFKMDPMFTDVREMEFFPCKP